MLECSLPSNQNRWKFQFYLKDQILLLWQPFIPGNIQDMHLDVKTNN